MRGQKKRNRERLFRGKERLKHSIMRRRSIRRSIWGRKTHVLKNNRESFLSRKKN